MPSSKEYMRKYNHGRAPRKLGLEIAAYRQAALIRYGGKCTCCNEDNHAFLVFDHIYGDNKDKNGSRFTYYRSLAVGPLRTDIQVLCANCNMAKERPGGCPHQATPLDSA